MALLALRNFLRRTMNRPEFGGLTMSDLRQLVTRPDPVILEIGAHDGTHTRAFASAFPGATIHAFEPDPRAAAKWRAQVDAPNVTLHTIAIGAQDGAATFHQSASTKESGAPSHDASGSLRAPKNHLEAFSTVSFPATIEVTVKRLDSWCADEGVDRIDFIWADLQGAERDLIAGGGEALRRCRHFYTEYDNRELYEGQWTLDQIAAALPTHKLRRRWRADALFEHREMAA